MKFVKYFFVGLCLWSALTACAAILLGTAFGMHWLYIHHNFIGKVVVDVLLAGMITAFITMYGWLMCS
jgi:hypothetical protein